MLIFETPSSLSNRAANRDKGKDVIFKMLQCHFEGSECHFLGGEGRGKGGGRKGEEGGRGGVREGLEILSNTTNVVE